MVTETKEEALAILAATRKELIAQARSVAIRLCAQNGRTHARAVWREMQRLNIDTHDDSIKGHWMGVVFNSGPFVKTDDSYFTQPDDYPQKAGKSHAGLDIPWWKLRP